MLARLPNGERGIRILDEVAPRLVDTVFRDELEGALRRFDPVSLDRYAGIHYSRGVIAAATGEETRALDHFVRARSHLDRRTELAARIGLEMARIHLLRTERSAADAVLAWSESVLGTPQQFADVLLLQALIAKDVGDHRASLPLYRASIASKHRLTPMSSVLALTNLAIALHHATPHEGVALCRAAIATIESELLHPVSRPAARNIMGYALMCTGALEAARETLQEATGECQALSDHRRRLFAEFNIAIVDELQGLIERATQGLGAVAEEARVRGFGDIVQWSEIRRRWLALRSGVDWSVLLKNSTGLAGAHFVESTETLRALILARGTEHSEPHQRLADLAQQYVRKDDYLTAFVLYLWIAHLHHTSGHDQSARRSLRMACEIGRPREFRLSPNWWAPEIVETAWALAPPSLADYVGTFQHATDALAHVVEAVVELVPDGTVRIDGRTLPAEYWRAGRSGSGVLRRYFRFLLDAGHRGVDREELAAHLWPESEGDLAIRNLYWATRDLRRVLRSIPGVVLSVDGGAYRLRFGANVSRLN